jgi:hypothetical protein
MPGAFATNLTGWAERRCLEIAAVSSRLRRFRRRTTYSIASSAVHDRFIARQFEFHRNTDRLVAAIAE